MKTDAALAHRLAHLRCAGREAVVRAVGHLHPIFPWQAVLACYEVVHEGVRAVALASVDGYVRAVTELVGVVLDSPALACLVGAAGDDLACDQLVRTS